nr:MAG TPA: hypothetical protein [Caudoviricetes sp.]
MSTIKRTEYTHNGRRVILGACELAANRYETMLMYPNGQEITYRTASTEADALRDFEVILAAYPADKKPEAPKPLTGKYAKLRDDLRKVYEIGKAAAAQVDDGGTCNFDAPSISLPRWQSAKVKQACKEAGCGCFEWKSFGRRWIISFRIAGQAYKRETAAEAMTKALAGMGYDALTYCAID